jgi:Type II secretion system (T2SS), protein M subtype b
MIAQMSQREKVLATIIGGVIAVLVTFVLVKFFLGHHTQIKKDLGVSEAKIKQLRGLESERALWAQRDAWLTAEMPVLEDSAVANKQLTDAIKEVAKKHTVILEAPNPGIPSKQPNYTALGIRVSARAAWRPLAEFIRELQTPGQFIVLDPVELKVDPNDKTQMKADMTISKWFAPQR